MLTLWKVPTKPRLMMLQKPSIVIGMNCAHNVLALGVVNGGVRISLAEPVVASPLIGAEQANLVCETA